MVFTLHVDLYFPLFSFGGLLVPTHFVCCQGCSWNNGILVTLKSCLADSLTFFILLHSGWWIFLNSIGTDWLFLFGFWVPGHGQHAYYELLLTAYSRLRAFQQSKFTKYDLPLEMILTLTYTLSLFSYRTSAWAASVMDLLRTTSLEGGKSMGVFTCCLVVYSWYGWMHGY
jgi:hypothetical protein